MTIVQLRAGRPARPTPPARPGRSWWPLVRWVGIAALAGALVWRLGAGGLAAGLVAGLQVLGPEPVLAALAIGLLTTVCNAARWCLVAARLGMRLPLATAVADSYQAQLLNSVLPAGVLGDVHRAVERGREAGDVARGARAVAIERLAGLVVLVAVAVAVLLAQPALLHVTADLVPVGGWWLAAVLPLAAAGAAWALRDRLRPALRAAAADVRAVLRATPGRPCSACRSSHWAATSRCSSSPRGRPASRRRWRSCSRCSCSRCW
ncbi:hypothetical protein BJF78_02465 [Pseudonocardia sp. CNS-139]|nr:hypothetical protein BJF78_02465 [Pseudonocardia sp. CNS-139]